MSLDRRQKSKPKLLKPVDSATVTNPNPWHKLSQMNSQTNFDNIIKSKTQKKILPTIAEKKQMIKTNSKQLSNYISKLKYMNTRSQMQQTQQIIRIALNVIKCFSKIENNFQETFQHLYAVFKRFSFVVEDLQMFNKHGISQGVSYKSSCYVIQQQLKIKEQQSKIKVQMLQDKNTILEEYMKKQKKQMEGQKKTLTQQVEMYKKLANIDYVRGLEKKIITLKEEISEKIQQYTILARSNQQAYGQITQLKNTIDKLENYIQSLRSQMYKLETSKEKYQKNMNNLKDRFDDLLGKMIGLQQKIATVQQQNSNLITQRNKIINRGAVGFQNLTPRPKYNQLFGKNDLEKIALNSTQHIFLQLVNESKIQKDKFVINHVILKKLQNLKEAENIRKDVVNNIIQSKKHIFDFI